MDYKEQIQTIRTAAVPKNSKAEQRSLRYLLWITSETEITIETWSLLLLQKDHVLTRFYFTKTETNLKSWKRLSKRERGRTVSIARDSQFLLIIKGNIGWGKRTDINEGFEGKEP